MCDSCEEGDDYAEGYTVGEEVEGGLGWDGLKADEWDCCEDMYLTERRVGNVYDLMSKHALR